MVKTPVPVSLGFYVSDSKKLSNQRCIGLMPHKTETESLSRDALFGIEGIEQIFTTGDANYVNRGSKTMAGIPYFVNGNFLYKLNRTISVDSDITYSYTEIGYIEGTKRCSMATNGTQLMVLVPGGNGYIYDESNTPAFQQITAAGFTANGNPQYVVFNDSFFIVSTDTKKFIKSGANDGLSWSATDFGSAESNPDSIVAPFVYQDQLYMAGSKTLELFDNIGGSSFPYRRNQGFVVNRGVSVAESVLEVGGALFWIGGDENENSVVWALMGDSTPIKVSTKAIDIMFAELSIEDLDNTFGWSYATDNGYVVGYTSPRFTVVYDLYEKKWHERESSLVDILDNNNNNRWRVNSVVRAFNKLIVFDNQDGRVGILNKDIYMEYDRPLFAIFTTQPIYNMGENMNVGLVELICESGVADQNEDEPVVEMAVSKDGGRTYRGWYPRGIGYIGEYTKRQIWRGKVGHVSPDLVLKFRMSGNHKKRILGLLLGIK